MLDYTISWETCTSIISGIETCQSRLFVERQRIWRSGIHEECYVSVVAYSTDRYAVIEWDVNGAEGQVCEGAVQCSAYRIFETARQGSESLKHYIISHVLPSYLGTGGEI